MISQTDGVAQRRYCQRVFFQTRKPRVIGYCTEAEDKVIELQSVLMVIKAVGNDDFSMFDIDLQDFTSKKMDTPQHLARRIHDRREIQVAGCNFVMQRR